MTGLFWEKYQLYLRIGGPCGDGAGVAAGVIQAGVGASLEPAMICWVDILVTLPCIVGFDSVFGI